LGPFVSWLINTVTALAQTQFLTDLTSSKIPKLFFKLFANFSLAKFPRQRSHSIFETELCPFQHQKENKCKALWIKFMSSYYGRNTFADKEGKNGGGWK
jgi:hypothetical protein